jgi:hypothetical protein
VDIKERIAGLPKYPAPPDNCAFPSDQEWTLYRFEVAAAALARLALAREWIEKQPHDIDANGIYCKAFNPGTRLDCTCGRDALLAALEVPRG